MGELGFGLGQRREAGGLGYEEGLGRVERGAERGCEGREVRFDRDVLVGGDGEGIGEGGRGGHGRWPNRSQPWDLGLVEPG